MSEKSMPSYKMSEFDMGSESLRDYLVDSLLIRGEGDKLPPGREYRDGDLLSNIGSGF